MKSLVEFWRKCPLDKPPFVHPDDRPALLRYSKSRPDLPTYRRFHTFVKSSQFGNFSDRRLHFSLVPVPYTGDLAGAEIFILQLNPGLTLIDYYGECCVPQF